MTLSRILHYLSMTGSFISFGSLSSFVPGTVASSCVSINILPSVSRLDSVLLSCCII